MVLFRGGRVENGVVELRGQIRSAEEVEGVSLIGRTNLVLAVSTAMAATLLLRTLRSEMQQTKTVERLCGRDVSDIGPT